MNRTIARQAVVLVVALSLTAEPVFAHIGGLAAANTGAPPLWLVLLIGGAIIAGSYLFATLLTDHEAIQAVNAWQLNVTVGRTTKRILTTGTGVGGLLVLVGLVYVAFTGPAYAPDNATILFVWGLWWAGYTMSVYVVGDTWRLFNPWRQLARLLPGPRRSYPDRFGDWPAIVGLLGMIWLEVVSPVSSNPRLLGLVIVLYSAATLTGATIFGREVWFERVDPVARVFRCFGRVAPLQRTDDGLRFGVPGSALATPDAHRGERWYPDEPRFVVALLWATTFDGFVSTPLWADIARPFIEAGIPALLLYALALAAGYVAFLAAYRLATAYSRATAETFVTPQYIGNWFAPALVPIAAGYHIAHFLGYLIQLSPKLVAAASSPLTGAAATASLISVPSWFSVIQLVFVLAGHMFAIWIAHALSFELFPGKLQPIRSQYPFTVVMVFYTMVSMWIIAQPFNPTPFV